MRLALDTNVLIYAHMPSLDDHSAVRRWLLDRLRDEDASLVVVPIVLHEFVHVITDGRRFDPPVAMGEALEVANGYLGRSNVECVAIDEDAVTLGFELLDRHGLGRKRIADALLAATLVRHDVSQIVTCDPKGFEVFEGLEVVDPRT